MVGNAGRKDTSPDTVPAAGEEAPGGLGDPPVDRAAERFAGRSPFRRCGD